MACKDIAHVSQENPSCRGGKQKICTAKREEQKIAGCRGNGDPQGLPAVLHAVKKLKLAIVKVVQSPTRLIACLRKPGTVRRGFCFMLGVSLSDTCVGSETPGEANTAV